MSASWNFARRPFQDDRPAHVAAVLLLFAGLALLVVNVRIFTAYRRGVAGVLSEIAALETRQRGADAKAREAKAALSSYRVSSLAEQSRELSRIASEHRFSWTGLLARLERTLPSEVGIQRLQPHFDKDGGVALDLQLVGRSREAVVPTIAALARDPAFGAVQLLSESQPEGNTAEPFQFQVTSRYAPGPQAAPGVEKKPAPKPAPEKKPAKRAGPGARR